MSDEQDFTPIQRILVPLDSSQESLSAVEPAAWIASVMHSKLMALLVEEQELFTLANLPFSREISLPHATGRNLDPSRLEQEMRTRAASIEKAIGKIALRYKVDCTFKVVRGERDMEVAAQTGERDLIALWRERRAREPSMRVVASPAAGRSGSGYLVISRSVAFNRGPVSLLFTGTPASVKALRFSIALARAGGVPLRVLIMGGGAGQLRQRERRAAEVLQGSAPPGLRFVIRAATKAALYGLCLRQEGLLVLTDEVSERDGALVDRVMTRACCPVIVLKVADTAAET